MTVACYPAYDAAEKSTWMLGLADSGTDFGVDAGVTGTSDKWSMESMLLPLLAGTYTLTELKFVIKNAIVTNCDKVYFGILKVLDLAGTPAASFLTFASGLNYIDCSASRVNSNTAAILTHAMNETITLVSQEGGLTATYYYVIGLHAPAGHTTACPTFKRMTNAVGQQGLLWNADAVASWDASLLTYRNNASGVEQIRASLKFTTTQRTIYAGSYSAAISRTIPRCTDKDYWIIMKTAIVADAQAFTCKLDTDVNAAESIKTTLVVDMGTTNQMTFGGVNVAVVAAEPGDTYNLGINIRPVTGKMDLFYLNLTNGQGPLYSAGTVMGDFTTKSHACAGGTPARDAEYTVAAPSWLNMSGTAAVASIEIGWQPIVVIGDENGTVLAGALKQAFTVGGMRMWWNACIDGNRLASNTTASTAAYLRYKSASPGVGDLCEMTGVLMVLAGLGVYDIETLSDTAVERSYAVSLYAQRLATILADVANRPTEMSALVIGLPAYGHSNANTHEAKTIQFQLNAMLEGLCIGARCPFYDPWVDTINQATLLATIPKMLVAYSTAGLLYTSVAATLVAANAIRAYEGAVVGGPFRAYKAWRTTGIGDYSLRPDPAIGIPYIQGSIYGP